MNQPRTEVANHVAHPGARAKTSGVASLELVPGADPYIAELVRQYDWALTHSDSRPGSQTDGCEQELPWFPAVRRKPH